VVCPGNKKKDFHLHPELEPEPERVKPELKPMLRISNRQLKEQFGHMAGSWRGKKPLQRTAIIGLGHDNDETAWEELIHVMTDDVRPMMRGTAAWSIGKIGTAEGYRAIEEAMEPETDESVLFEMEKGRAFESMYTEKQVENDG